MTNPPPNPPPNLLARPPALYFAISDRKARREVWEAFKVSPAGVHRCAVEAQDGQNPAALLVHKIRTNEHLRGPRRTGWRWVRGTHSGTYKPDPEGTDPLPPGYGVLG